MPKILDSYLPITERDQELLTLADIWVNRAYDYVKSEDAAFYTTDIEITPITVGFISIYHTSSGVHLVQALISKAMGDYSTHYRCVMNFIADASKPCENIDLTVGKSSVLVGCTLLHESIGNEQDALLQELQQFGNTIMNDIWDKIDTYGPISGTNPIRYKSIAHG